MKLTAGTALQSGKYLINRVAGQSSVRLTLQATQTDTQRPVMLQTLQRELQADPQFASVKQRFQTQIDRFAHCQHPGLVRLIHSFEEDGLPFAVMDYTPGQTLAEVIQTGGPLSEDAAIRYIQQVGAALMVLHQHGVIHQQLAPQSIIRPVGSEIVVLVNIALATPAALGIRSATPITGLSEYAAIEQYQPQIAPTPATDEYALAGTLYFLLTGRSPVAAPRRGQTPLPTPRQLRPDLSSAIEAAMLRGLELNPKARPATIADWLSLLPQPSLGKQSPVAAIPNSPPPALAQIPDQHGDRHSENGHAPAAKPKDTTPSTEKMATVKRSSISRQLKPRLPVISSSGKYFSKTLITVAAVAASIGLGAGFAIRIAASSTGPGASIFHSEQSFPAIEGWSSQVEPATSPAVISKPTQTTSTRREPPAVRPQPVAPPPKIEETPAATSTPTSTAVESPPAVETVPNTPIVPELPPPQAQPTPLPEPELPSPAPSATPQ